MGEKTQHIICAVRGSPQSQKTVTRAIELALEASARLTFFYAVDVEFQAQAAIGSPLSIVYRELIELSEFTMVILCDRARRRGVEQVDYLIREGNVPKQLMQLAAETEADVLVLGWPMRGSPPPTFKPERFDRFVAELERTGKPRLVLVPPADDMENAL